MGRFVIRTDHSHTSGGTGQLVGSSAASVRRTDPGVAGHIAPLVGDGKLVLIQGEPTAALTRALVARGCRTSSEGEGGGEAETTRFDAVVVTDLLGSVEGPRERLRALRERLRPEGSLIVALTGIVPVGDRLTILDGEPLGAGSGLVFTEDGLYQLLEEADFAIGHVATMATAPPVAESGEAGRNCRDWVIVAHPLPLPGLDFLQGRMRDLARRAEESAREAEALRQCVAVADRQREVLAEHQRWMAGRINDLRARLVDAHAQLVRRDDELRKTFGDTIGLRNALLIERDSLIAQGQALLADRDAIAAERDTIAAERDALRHSLRAAELRLNVFRASPLGRAYGAIRNRIRGGGNGNAHHQPRAGND